MKFTDENKEVKEFSNDYFTYGVHKVQIAEITLGNTKPDAPDTGKEFVEVTVVDPENAEITDAARVWFSSDKAANYSFNTLRQIFIHNTPEAKRDQAKELFDKVTDTEALVAVLQTLLGKECWFTKYPSQDRTYTDQQGNERPSIDKNVMGYEPKLKLELMPKGKDGITDLGSEITKDNVEKVFPGAQEVPFESAGDAPGSTVPPDDAWSGK